MVELLKSAQTLKIKTKSCPPPSLPEGRGDSNCAIGTLQADADFISIKLLHQLQTSWLLLKISDLQQIETKLKLDWKTGAITLVFFRVPLLF